MVFKRLVALFVQVDKHSDENKMASRNIAIVFAPTLLRYSVSDLTKMLAQSESANRVILLCINHYVDLFEVSYLFIGDYHMD